MQLLLDNPKEIAKDHFLLRMDVPDLNSAPGQFINIRIGHQTDPLLRRPFSIHNEGNGIMEIIFKVVGRGTEMLRDCIHGSTIDIMAPLGKGFTLLDRGRALLVGGGVGNAPLYYLAKKLKGKGIHVSYLFGARSKDHIYLRERYQSSADDFIMATDDGSEGRRGMVSDISRDILRKETFDRIYLCGPTGMMKAMAAVLADFLTPFEVSVENYFGCGIGLCSGCTLETVDGMKRACVDGPVFDGKVLNWDSL